MLLSKYSKTITNNYCIHFYHFEAKRAITSFFYKLFVLFYKLFICQNISSFLNLTFNHTEAHLKCPFPILKTALPKLMMTVSLLLYPLPKLRNYSFWNCNLFSLSNSWDLISCIASMINKWVLLQDSLWCGIILSIKWHESLSNS